VSLKIIDYLFIFFGSLLLFLFSSLGWMEENFMNVKPAIYIIFFSFICLNSLNIFKYLKGIYLINIKNLDFYILLSIILFFIIQKEINLYAISFLSLYIFISTLYSHSIESRSFNLNIVLYCIFISGLFSTLGIYAGFFESLLFQSSLLHEVQPINYPNPTSTIIKNLTGFSLSNHISGFQISINYSAYSIISSLAVCNFLPLKGSLKKAINLLFVFALLLTQAKVGLIYIAILIVLKVSKNMAIQIKYSFIFLICLGYLLLTHITIIETNSIIISNKYYRELAFSFFNYDFYLSLFSWLKLVAFEYIKSSNFINADLNGYFQISGNMEPHSLFFSSILIGGLGFAFLLLARILLIIKNYFSHSNSQEDFFTSAMSVFVIESFLLDSYDLPVFWLIILLAKNYQIINIKK
jgi:hypothetical protein